MAGFPVIPHPLHAAASGPLLPVISQPLRAIPAVGTLPAPGLSPCRKRVRNRVIEVLLIIPVHAGPIQDRGVIAGPTSHLIEPACPMALWDTPVTLAIRFLRMTPVMTPGAHRPPQRRPTMVHRLRRICLRICLHIPTSLRQVNRKQRQFPPLRKPSPLSSRTAVPPSRFTITCSLGPPSLSSTSAIRIFRLISSTLPRRQR